MSVKKRQFYIGGLAGIYYLIMSYAQGMNIDIGSKEWDDNFKIIVRDFIKGFIRKKENGWYLMQYVGTEATFWAKYASPYLIKRITDNIDIIRKYIEKTRSESIIVYDEKDCSISCVWGYHPFKQKDFPGLDDFMVYFVKSFCNESINLTDGNIKRYAKHLLKGAARNRDESVSGEYMLGVSAKEFAESIYIDCCCSYESDFVKSQVESLYEDYKKKHVYDTKVNKNLEIVPSKWGSYENVCLPFMLPCDCLL